MMTFKHNAMTPDEIIESLNEHNRLFIFVSEGLLKGYLYLQVDTERNNAEIKYFSSHMDYRLKGIAFDLLEYALKYAFEHYTIHKVYFKIRNKIANWLNVSTSWASKLTMNIRNINLNPDICTRISQVD